MHALSAHEIFKGQYTRTLRWSAVVALLVLVLAVIFMPEYLPTPYRLTQDMTQLIEIQMEAPPLEEPKPEISRPRVVQPATEDDPDVEDFPELPPMFFPDPVIPGPRYPVDNTPFVATSSNPRLVQGAVADYPEIARLAGMQGTVVVKVQVDKDGSVAQVQLLKGVHPLLDKPALAAARKLRFTPGTQRQNPVRCWVAVPFRFYLH